MATFDYRRVCVGDVCRPRCPWFEVSLGGHFSCCIRDGKPFSPLVVLFLAQSTLFHWDWDLFLLLWFCFRLKATLGNLFLLLWFCFWPKAALGNLKQHWETFFSSLGHWETSSCGSVFGLKQHWETFFASLGHWETFFSSCGSIFGLKQHWETFFASLGHWETFFSSCGSVFGWKQHWDTFFSSCGPFFAWSITGKPFSPPVVLFLSQSSTGNLFLLLWFCFWPKAALGPWGPKF